MLEALLGLFIKHFICDFPLQTSPWMYRNKGIYLHPGGITHAAVHGVGALLVLTPFVGVTALKFALLDMLIHYHIDWAKMNIGKRYNLRPDNSNWFWILLGFDQFLHQLTYFLIVFLAF